MQRTSLIGRAVLLGTLLLIAGGGLAAAQAPHTTSPPAPPTTGAPPDAEAAPAGPELPTWSVTPAGENGLADRTHFVETACVLRPLAQSHHNSPGDRRQGTLDQPVTTAHERTHEKIRPRDAHLHDRGHRAAGSPGGLVALARGQAVLEGRSYVTPEDVKSVAVPALAHRLSLRPELWVRRVTGDDIVTELLSTVPSPR